MSSKKMSFWQKLGLILAIAFIAWVIIHSIIKYFKNLELEVRKIHSEVRSLWHERLLIKEKRIKLKKLSNYIMYSVKILLLVGFYFGIKVMSDQYGYNLADAFIRTAGLVTLTYGIVAGFFKWKMYKLTECLEIVERKIEETTYRLGRADDKRIGYIQLTIDLKMQQACVLKQQLIFRKMVKSDAAKKFLKIRT